MIAFHGGTTFTDQRDTKVDGKKKKKTEDQDTKNAGRGEFGAAIPNEGGSQCPLGHKRDRPLFKWRKRRGKRHRENPR